MLRKILIGVVAVIAVLIIAIAVQPKDFKVERSATMMAPRDIVYTQLVDFHNWVAWSPWESIDPKMEKSFSGSPMGTGSIYEWRSENKQVGSGRMTMTDAKEPDHIDIKLEFLAPMQATNDVKFVLSPSNDGTQVTWAMSGELNFMMKAFHLFANMDKMIGDDFERGLNQLAAVANAKAKAAAAEATPAPAEAAATPAPAPMPTPAH